MSPFLKEHLFGALIIGSGFGTAIGFAAFALPPGSVLQNVSRCSVAVIAVILVKLLFDTGIRQFRMVLWSPHLQGHPAIMRYRF
jgi:hypothetical protein